jgi:hypothetical protein
VREQLTGHDLIVVFGAPVFRYHAWTSGSYLPDGTQLVMITANSDQAARAPQWATQSLAIRLRRWNNCTVSLSQT